MVSWCYGKIDDSLCTGCFGCLNACKHEAIYMQLNPEGFYRPALIADKCVGCGLCDKYCPVLNSDSLALSNCSDIPECYAGWIDIDDIRFKSSSGGVFSALSMAIIKAGGYVAGCVLDSSLRPFHMLTNDLDDLSVMRGSKYLQSKVGAVYKEVVQLAESDKPVLFTGLPCQNAALKLLIANKNIDNIYLCELVCHGIPSIKAFDSFIRYQFGDDVPVEYHFRDKSVKGWGALFTYAKTRSGREFRQQLDLFGRGYASHHFYCMDACHDCKFCKLPRVADITMGDFWRIPEELYDERGVSLVCVNSARGADLLNSAVKDGSLVLKPVSFDVAKKSASRLTSGKRKKPLLRKMVLRSISKGDGFESLLKYFTLTKVLSAIQHPQGILSKISRLVMGHE